MKKRTIIAMILILISMCFLDGGANTAFAAETAKLTEDGYYVQKFSENEFAGYRATDGKHTYPKLSVEQDWLFAGWFTDEACTTSVGRVTTVTTDVYAKFVDADLSYIKCQVTPDTDVTSEKTNMRVISTVDSKNYSGAGFYVTYKGNTQTCSVSTLYSRLSATDDGMACGYSPIAFNEQGQYFSAIRLKNIGNANFDEPFYIQSYWKTLDGTTVSGMSRYVRVEDSYNQIVNVPVRVDEEANVTEGSVSVVYDSEKFSYIGYDASVNPVFENVTVNDNSGAVTITGTSTGTVSAEGLLANLRLQLKADAGLESVTTFGVSGESFKNGATAVTLDVSDVVFKNYPLAYGGTPDTSWYDEFCDQEEETYIISSAADLYGLAKIVNDKSDEYKNEQFVDDKIILGADVVINEGESDITGWTPKGTTPYEWIPIGYTSSNRFNGLFDGGGHTISGIYLYDDDGTTAYYCGLFGITGVDSVLQNFKIVNSYFESKVGWETEGSTYALMGSVVGQLAGDMYSVYSDADVVSVNKHVGGLIGRANPDSASGVFNIDDCWFSGNVQVSRPREIQQFVGGIVGDMIRGELHITNTMNSGTVTMIFTDDATVDPQWNVGGIVGGTETWSTPSLIFENCLNTGKVSIQNGNNNWGTGAIVGRLNDNCKATFTDVYATSESHSKVFDYVRQPSTTVTQVAEADITGHVAYDTDVKNLGIYVNGADEASNKWVITENGTPELRKFSDTAIDVGWYYDNNVKTTDATVTIYTPEQLYGFSAVSQDYNFSGDTVKLGADITLNSGSASLWSQGISTPERMFTPIATASESGWFKGSFDGQGHTISGLWIDGSGANGTGLFGGANVGSIANVLLKNSCIKSDTAYTGSIIGFLSGNITNVYSDAYVTSTGQETGGLVGRFGGGGSASTPKQIMSECWFDGTVEVATQYVGGLIGRVECGYNGKSVVNSLNSGDVTSKFPSGDGYVGGIAGAADSRLYTGSIQNTMHVGTVNSKTEYAVGAVVGYIRLSNNSSDRVFLFENVYTTQALGANNNTYICGVGNSKNAQTINGTPALISEGDITGENASIYTALEFYDTDSTSNVWGAISEGKPVVKSLYKGNVMTGLCDDKISTGWYYNSHSFVGTTSATTTPNNLTTKYTISTPEELYGLAKLVNDNTELFQGKTVMLADDITLNEGEATPDGWEPAEGAAKHEWTPIGCNTEYVFAGTFDGRGHTISGVYLDDDQTASVNSGLFGMTTYTSEIKNFRLTNSYFKRTCARAYMGSVIGLMDGGRLDSVFSDAIVVSNGYQFGGLVGRAEYITDALLATESDKNVYINNCWFDGYVHAIENTSFDVGGIVGIAQHGEKGAGVAKRGSLEGVINITNCINSGKVTKDGKPGNSSGDNASFVGGIIGRDNWYPLTININNCLNTGKITVNDDNQTGVDAIMGAAHHESCVVNITNTCISNESSPVTPGTDWIGVGLKKAKTVTSNAKHFSKSDLTGYWGYANLKSTVGLNLYSYENQTGAFVIKEDSTPELKQFAKDWLDFGWFYDHRAEDSFTIHTVEELYTLPIMVNNIGSDTDYGYNNNGWKKINGFADKTIYLGADITLNQGSAEDWANKKNRPSTSWIPIGNSESHPFKGTFNGNNHTISGLYLNIDYNFPAMFGATVDADIMNLKLVNSYLTTSVNQYGANLGSIVGYGYGDLTNIYSDAILQGYTKRIGGLIGTISSGTSNLTNCWFNGRINADVKSNDSLDIGGLVGYANRGTNVFDTCLYTGTITFNFTCTNHAKSGHGAFVGALCGRDYANNGYVQFKNCISAGEINANWLNNPEDNDRTYDPSGFSYITGTIGRATAGSATTQTGATGPVYTLTKINTYIEYTGEKKILGTKYSSADENADFSKVDGSWFGHEEDLYGIGAYMLTELPFTDATNTWTAVEGHLPVPTALKTMVSNSLDVATLVDTSWYTGDRNTYTLTDKADLYGFSKLSQTNDFAGQTIELGDSITFVQLSPGQSISDVKEVSSDNRWYPIGRGVDGKRFAGTFDGKKKTISGLYMELPMQELGFFAATEVGSTVQNLRMKDSYIKQEGTDNDNNRTGSIISDCRGEVSNVYSNAIICSETEQVGGIVARANGYDYSSDKRTESAITNCWFDGVIDLNDDGRRGGGIVGCLIQGEWTLTNCLFTGSIDSEYTGSSNAYLGGMVSEVKAPATKGNATGDSVITLKSCVSAGTITTTAKIADKGVGALVGVMQASISMDEDGTFNEPLQTKMIRENVFATRETAARDVYGFVSETSGDYTAEATLEGDEVIWTHNADRLVGYCSEDTITGTYEGGKLDFNSAWILRDKGTPVPAAFEEMVTKVDASTLDTALGLDKWNASLSSAIHQGVGRYILRFGSATEKSYDTYAAYVEHLLKSEADGGLGFTQYADTTSGDTGTKVYSGIYTKEQGDWVLNVVCSENSGITTITIHTGIKETLSPNLKQDAVAQATGETQDMSITMMQLTGTYQDNSYFGDMQLGDSYFYGNSFVIQLPEKGHFIINDGGNVGDYNGLITYLKEQAGTQVAEDGTVKNPVYIDAWTVSHQHADHFSAVEGFVSNPEDVKAVFVEAFYINEPNNRALYYVDGSLEGTLEAQYRGVRICRTSDGEKTPVYWYHTGERYYFNGITMDVIQSQEQISVSSYGKRNAGGAEGTDFNTASGILLFTTANNKKILIGGDGNYVNMKRIMDMYGTNEGYTAAPLLQNINVFTAWHHGKNTSYDITKKDNRFTEYLTKNKNFDVVLYPCSLIYGDSSDPVNAFPVAGEANEYLNTKTTKHYHYGDGNVTITLE